MQFVGNKVLRCGAIHLHCSSDSENTLVCFDDMTRIYMTNNTALENGGTIAARENCRGNSSLWFHGREACQRSY